MLQSSAEQRKSGEIFPALRTPEKVFYEKVADIVLGEFWNLAKRQQEMMTDE